MVLYAGTQTHVSENAPSVSSDMLLLLLVQLFHCCTQVSKCTCQHCAPQHNNNYDSSRPNIACALKSWQGKKLQFSKDSALQISDWRLWEPKISVSVPKFPKNGEFQLQILHLRQKFSNKKNFFQRPKIKKRWVLSIFCYDVTTDILCSENFLSYS